MTTATRYAGRWPASGRAHAPVREARDGRLDVRVDLEDAGEAGELQDPAHVRLHGGEAQVAAALPRLLHRLQQRAQPGARRVVHAGEVADDADAALADLLAERGDEVGAVAPSTLPAIATTVDGPSFDDVDLGSSVTSGLLFCEHQSVSRRRDPARNPPRPRICG